jgi:hypothetical protein
VTRAARALAALSLLLPLALAGCGRDGGPTGAAVAVPSARAEAIRLLDLAPVPPGGATLHSPPAGLDGPLTGTPMVDSLIDLSRSWRVPMPLDQAEAWVSAHRPAGLTQGSLSPGSTSWGISWHEPDGELWEDAQLAVSLVADGPTVTTMRADGMTVGLDPHPLADRAPGARLHATVAGGCPASARGDVGVAAPEAPELRQRLLPQGAPTAGLVCVYGDGRGASLALTAQHRLDAATAGRVATQVDAVKLAHPVGGQESCPSGRFVDLVVALSYPGRPDAGLWYEPTGCSSVANGAILAGPAVLPALAPYVPKL